MQSSCIQVSILYTVFEMDPGILSVHCPAEPRQAHRCHSSHSSRPSQSPLSDTEFYTVCTTASPSSRLILVAATVTFIAVIYTQIEWCQNPASFNPPHCFPPVCLPPHHQTQLSYYNHEYQQKASESAFVVLPLWSEMCGEAACIICSHLCLGILWVDWAYWEVILPQGLLLNAWAWRRIGLHRSSRMSTPVR